MKHLKPFVKIPISKLFALFLIVFIVACNNDDDNNNEEMMQEETTIVDLAVATDDLSILVDALTAANLVSTLQGEGPFTVFAPTNEAFGAFLTANGFSSLEDVPTDVLTNVLLNHVVSGENLSTGLSTGYISSLSPAGAEGRNLSLFINTANGVEINGVASVSSADNATDNGVVHIVDAVIGLPNIVDQALANPEFSSLVGALTDGGNTTFTDLLSQTNTTFTVFAPVNNAFTNFTNPNGNAIANVLSYHVVPGDAAYSDELMNMYVNTAGTNADGDALSQYINTDDGVTINGSSTVAVADVVTTNGVVHAVDTVIDLPTVVTFAAADPNFSTLVDALTTLTPSVDFVSVLSSQDGNGDDPFTVFAPTNDAFASITVPGENDLIPILQHHVIAAANIRSGDLTANGSTMTPATLEGDSFTITLPGTSGNIGDITDGAGNDGIGLIAVDVQAYNGVIHVVNQVLLPNTSN
ncbi:MAG: fasciclin domain-containing protein [Allomuricauda sp.]|nr:MAG: fasciclin domain-containing protein [Allomuricauda sp.]